MAVTKTTQLTNRVVDTNPQGSLSSVNGMVVEWDDNGVSKVFKCLGGLSWKLIEVDGVSLVSRTVRTFAEMKGLDDLTIDEIVFCQEREVNYKNEVKDLAIVLHTSDADNVTDNIMCTGADVKWGTSWLPGDSVELELFVASLDDINGTGPYHFWLNRSDVMGWGLRTHNGGTQLQTYATSSVGSSISAKDKDGFTVSNSNLPIGEWFTLKLTINTAYTFTEMNLGYSYDGDVYDEQVYRMRSIKINKATPETFNFNDDTGDDVIGSLGSTFRYWDLEGGAPVGTLVREPAVVGDDYDIVDTVNSVLRIQPLNSQITPVNYGGVSNPSKVSNDNECSVVIQACIDSQWDFFWSPGFWLLNNTIYINKAKLITLVGGGPDDPSLEGSNIKDKTTVYTTNNAVNLFEIFSEGVFFDKGVFDVSRVVYDQDAIYNIDERGRPDYLPPSVFRYFCKDNLIQSGKIDTTILGDQFNGSRYGAGHIGVSIDTSRTNPNGKNDRPGAGEMHYLDFIIESFYTYSPIYTSASFPQQDTNLNSFVSSYDYSNPATTTVPISGQMTQATNDLGNILVHKISQTAQDNGDKFEDMEIYDKIVIGQRTWTIQSVTDNGTYVTFNVSPEETGLSGTGVLDFSFNYEKKSANIFTYSVRSGKDKTAIYISGNGHASKIVNSTSQPGEILNDAFKYSGYRDGTSLQLQNADGAGEITLIDTGNALTINLGDYVHVSGVINLINRGVYQAIGTPTAGSVQLVSTEGKVPVDEGASTGKVVKWSSEFTDTSLYFNEKAYSVAELHAGEISIDMRSIDLGKGGYEGETISNTTFINFGSPDISLSSKETFFLFNNNTSRGAYPPVNNDLILNNGRYFSYIQNQQSTGKDGFIDKIDNAFFMLANKATVAYNVYKNDGSFNLDSPDPAVDGVDGITVDPNSSFLFKENLWKFSSSISRLSYDSGFGDKDFFEIYISNFHGFTSLEVMKTLLLYYLDNYPLQTKFIYVGSGDTQIKTYDLSTYTADRKRIEFDNQGVNTIEKIIIRFIGVKSTSSDVWISDIMAKSKEYWQPNIPMLNIGGYQSVHGPLTVNGVLKGRADGTKTGTELDLANAATGNYYFMGNPQSHTVFTVGSKTTGGFAIVKLNTASTPTVTGATKIGTVPWVNNTNQKMRVEYDGATIEYWYL